MADRDARDPQPTARLSPVEGPVLLYDGTCGLCSSTVQFVLRHDPGGPLRFAALQGAVGQAIVARHATMRGVDSMMWVEPGSEGGNRRDGAEHVYVRSDAVLRVCAYLGGAWSLCRIGYLVPRALRDALYATVARHRHRLIGERCLVPEPGQRHRFINDDAGSGF